MPAMCEKFYLVLLQRLICGQCRSLRPSSIAQASFADPLSLTKALEGQEAVLSAAPFHHNPQIASTCKNVGAHYLDLTGKFSSPLPLPAVASTIFSPS